MPNLRRNEVPKIAGSEGGFIGLIIVLSAIFLASSTVVFFLLRSKNGGGRGRGHVSTFVERADSTYSSRRGLLGVFNRRQRGWRKQADGDEADEFDSESEDGMGIEMRNSTSASREKAVPPLPRSARRGMDVDLPALPHAYPKREETGDSMASMSSVTLEAAASPGSNMKILKGEEFRVRSCSPSPIRSKDDTSPREPRPAPTRAANHGSTQSQSSFSTFASGTKFREDITPD